MRRGSLGGGRAGRSSWWRIAAAAGSFAALLGLGCSGSVEAEGSTSSASSTGSGGGGGSGAGGAGGEGGGAVKKCGGFGGLACDADEWCDYGDHSCGALDVGGVCKPRPEGCAKDCPGACGCDGTFYCNACTAQSAGVDTSASMSCGQASEAYSAEAYFGGLDHLRVKKADKARDVCVTLHLARPTESSPGFAFTMPMEWGVVNAEISNKAADCYAQPGQQMGMAVGATGGMGTISFEVPPNGFFPCTVSVMGSLAFPPGEPWVQSSEALSAVDVAVKDGCF